MILIWRFGDCQITYAIIDPFILQAWVSLHTVLKTANLKSRQHRFLSKPPNIMFANNSAYTVYATVCTSAIVLRDLEGSMLPTKQAVYTKQRAWSISGSKH